MIKIEDVSVVYDSQIEALRHLTLTIDTNQCVGIIGENGSGKSTFISMLVGLVEALGTVSIDDMLLTKENMAKIRSHIGVVFQNPDHMLFMPTVYDNLAFGLINQGKTKVEIEDKIQTIAKQFDIEALLQRRANHLSGGQKRVVSLASVVVMEPQILVLDEPSAFLDPKSRRRIMNIIKELPQQILFSTHDLDMALDLCQEVILFNQGRVVKQGKTEDILMDKALLETNGLELPFRYQR